jgi:serine/threonine-protein kinase
MVRHRFRAVTSVLLVMGLATAFSSCGGADQNIVHPGSSTTHPGSSTTHPGSSTTHPGSSTVSNGQSSSPVTSSGTRAKSTVVPDVNSEPVLVAKDTLESAGLRLGTKKPEPNLNVNIGFVITTDPAVGTQVPTGLAVNLLVSTGPGGCGSCGPKHMPNVIGQTLQQATTTLAASGLTLGQYSHQASPEPNGIVIESTPAPGMPATSEIAVTLVLSSGQAGPTPSAPSTAPTPSAPSTAPTPSAPSTAPTPSPPSTGPPGSTAPASG